MALAAAIRHKGEQGGILTKEDLDEAIKLIGLYDIELERINHDMETAITQIKADALAKAAAVQADRTEWLGKAETFIHAKRDEVLKGKKSATLNFGKIGFRKKQDKLKLPEKGSEAMEALALKIEELKTKGEKAFSEVSTHTQRFVLAGDVKHLKDVDLSIVGLKRQIGEDEFYCEPDREKVKEVSNG